MGYKMEPVLGKFDADTKKLVGYEGLDGHEVWLPGHGDEPVASESSLDLNGASGEALKVKQLTELVTIADAATTETTIELPANAIILAVPVRVVTAIPTATTFNVGSGADDDRFAASVSVDADTIDAGELAGAYYNAEATPVLITPSDTPAEATGELRVTIFYIEVTPPTS